MKTRRILAASTAALCALGATAAYVALAATTSTEVSVAKGDTNGTITVASNASSFTLKVTGLSGLAAGTTPAANTIDVGTGTLDDGTLSATLSVPSGGGNQTFTYKLAVLDEDANDGSYKWSPVTVTIKVDVASSSSSESSSTSSSSTSFTDVEADEDGIEIGANTTVVIAENKEDLFEDYQIRASAITSVTDTNGKVSVIEGSTIGELGLSKTLNNELKKIDADKVMVLNITLAEDGVIRHTAPAPIEFTTVQNKNYKVYHVNGDELELVPSKGVELTNGKWRITFTTDKFSPFVLSTVEIKNAKGASNASNTTSAAANNGSNPSTGIALAIAPVVLAAGAVAVVALKKKH